MTIDSIVQELLDKKLISAKEAVILLTPRPSCMCSNVSKPNNFGDITYWGGSSTSTASHIINEDEMDKKSD